LQHFDVQTAAESLREREALVRLAPGLSSPLPFLFPSEGSSADSLLLRGAAIAWNGFTRFRQTGLPAARFAGSDMALPGSLGRWAPHGGLVLHDRQIMAPERLVLGVLAAAVDNGAVVANRIEATGILVRAGRVTGVRARDRIAQRDFELQADRVVNVAGPWAADLWPAEAGEPPSIGFARGVHVVADIEPPAAALGLPWREQDAGSRFRRARRVFVMPWAGLALIGASWDPTGSVVPQPLRPERDEVRRFVDSVADQWPDLGLELSRVRYAVVGLYPCFGRDRVSNDIYEVARHPLILDHRAHGGPEGLVTAIGVKLTTARAVAERIVDRLDESDGRGSTPGLTANRPPLDSATPSPVAGIGFEPVTDPHQAAELARAGVEHEQALSLADLFLRRSVAGQFGVPARDVLEAAAAELAPALGWSADRTVREVRTFENLYLPWQSD
jgi:glycerol-3-phosphate dehydrogenase